MSEEEKKAIDISKISLCVAHKYDKRNMIYNTSSLETLLDLLEKQQKEIEDLKRDYEIITDDMKNHNVVYTDMPEFEERYISKDKIRDILLKFQNEYGEDLETTGRLFIGKEVVQYGEDMLDEIAKELDIKLLEE